MHATPQSEFPPKAPVSYFAASKCHKCLINVINVSIWGFKAAFGHFFVVTKGV